MKKHTSYGIGGPAEAYIIPKDSDDLVRILNYAKEKLLSVHFFPVFAALSSLVL